MKYFCVLPYVHLQVRNGDTFAMCCYAKSAITEDEKPLKVGQTDASVAFNSGWMREARKTMADGKPFRACAVCYENEGRGGGSYRSWANQKFLSSPAESENLITQAREAEFEVPYSPRFLHLILGRMCNLKCRMCWAHNSSEIARDPVHGKWAFGPRDGLSKSELREMKSLSSEREAQISDLLGDVERLEEVYLTGGEPLVMPATKFILTELIRAGVHTSIRLRLNTNGTISKGEIFDLLQHFTNLTLNVSCDGVGEVYEYIRCPAKWATVKHNISIYQDRLPAAKIGISMLVQAYNVLYLDDITEYFEDMGIDVHSTILMAPYHLSAMLLPKPIRDIAADRLEKTGRLPTVSKFLRTEGPTGQNELLSKFMLFTNDLDASRSQSIHRSLPELVARLEECGVPWKEAVLHFRPVNSQI